MRNEWTKEVKKKKGKLIWKAWKYRKYRITPLRERIEQDEQPRVTQHQGSTNLLHSRSNKKGKQPMIARTQKRSTNGGDNSIILKLVKNPNN